MKNFNTLLTLSELKEHYGSPPVGICTLYNGKLDKTTVEPKTGNPIVLPPYIAITSLNISFSPQQAGTGDPSPENVRPISGRDNLTLTRCGENLFDPSRLSGGQITELDGTPVYQYIDNPTNFELSVPEFKNQAFRLTFKLAGPDTRTTSVRFVYTDGSYTSMQLLGGLGPVTATSDPQKTLAKITGVDSYSTTRYIDLSVTMLSLVAMDRFAPYQGDTYDITLPETVYGGTVDVMTGAGSKTWGFIASYNGEALPGEWISDRDAYTAGTTPTTGAQVAYKLADPEPFKVNPISIPSLSGINTIYSDADNLSCDFKITSFWSDAG